MESLPFFGVSVEYFGVFSVNSSENLLGKSLWTSRAAAVRDSRKNPQES